jgi:hypothetical protein
MDSGPYRRWFSVQQLKLALAGTRLDRVYVRAETPEGALGLALASLLAGRRVIESYKPKQWNGATICRIAENYIETPKNGWPPILDNGNQIYEYWVVKEIDITTADQYLPEEPLPPLVKWRFRKRKRKIPKSFWDRLYNKSKEN